jgi:hypothetical protein
MVEQMEEALIELEVSESGSPDRFELRRSRARKPRPLNGAITGRFVGWDSLDRPLVTFRGSPKIGVPASSITALEETNLGAGVVLMFDEGNREAPIILGVLAHSSRPAPKQAEAQVDGERVVFTANKEIVLRCGEASITLTRAGKIIIRGTYVLSRASGLNRIKGGVVHIN